MVMANIQYVPTSESKFGMEGNKSPQFSISRTDGGTNTGADRFPDAGTDASTNTRWGWCGAG